MNKIKLGVIGCGGRGRSLIKHGLRYMEEVEITALCDVYIDRAREAEQLIKEMKAQDIFLTEQAEKVIDDPNVQAVLIATDWELHIPLTIACMRAGKPVGVEVAGAYSIEQCWELVRTYQQTGTPVMLLENCCYGRRELMALHMANLGVFGEIVHCEGGYLHDLRAEMCEKEKTNHYRLHNYMARCCDNYPTHEIGPIARILNIHRGNRFLSLSSFSSKAKGLRAFIRENYPDDPHLYQARFEQGDIVTTVITCANGQTVRIVLDTTLPRYYSRGFTVRGTKGMFEEATDSIFLDGDENHMNWRSSWGNAEQFAERYEHPLWKRYLKEGVKHGHGGIDWLMLRDFADCLIHQKPFPIDVYDMAAWMSISVLSEQSIACGGMPVCFPDFTEGTWQIPK